MGPRGGVVTQRSAKARTPVQFRAWPPPLIIDIIKVLQVGDGSRNGRFYRTAIDRLVGARKNGQRAALGRPPAASACRPSGSRNWRMTFFHRAGDVGDWPVVAELIGAGSVCCDGGSRARAMLTWQPVCETEIVPSLHSNLAGAASATGAGFSAAAACCGAGTCASGFWNEAQPAHQTEINKTRSIRMFAASGSYSSGPCGWPGWLPTHPPVSRLSIQRPAMIRT